MKKTITTFILSLVLVCAPALFLVNAAVDNFTSSATVSDSIPTIEVGSGQTVTGVAGDITNVTISFNASDSNGNGDLNDATAAVNLTRDATTRESTTCSSSIQDSLTKTYDCNITLYYYDEAASDGWVITAYIEDDSANSATNNSVNATVQSIDSVTIVQTGISYSGAPGQSDVAADSVVQVNNTGNTAYSSTNLTGYTLSSGSDFIGIANVTVNVSNSASGQSLINATELLVADSNLSFGANAVQTFYTFLDIPSGQPTGTYNAQSAWVIEANT